MGKPKNTRSFHPTILSISVWAVLADLQGENATFLMPSYLGFTFGNPPCYTPLNKITFWEV